MTSKCLCFFANVCFDPLDDVLGSGLESEAVCREEIIDQIIEELRRRLEKDIPKHSRCRVSIDHQVLDYPESA